MFTPLTFPPSSNIDSMGYDGAKMELLVRYKSGTNKLYRGVDQETVDGIADCASTGKYIHRNVTSREFGIAVDRDGNPI